MKATYTVGGERKRILREIKLEKWYWSAALQI